MERLIDRELILLRQIDGEYKLVQVKHGATMAMLMACYELGEKDQIDLDTGIIKRHTPI